MWQKLDVKSSASNSKTGELYKGYNQANSSKKDQPNELISCEPALSFLEDEDRIVRLWQTTGQYGYREKTNILAEAAMLAYGQHYPLRLSADVFWLTIMKPWPGTSTTMPKNLDQKL